MAQPVITIDAALSALASAKTPDELIQLSNQAAALRVYARRAKLGMVAQNRCAEIYGSQEPKLAGNACQIVGRRMPKKSRPKAAHKGIGLTIAAAVQPGLSPRKRSGVGDCSCQSTAPR
jgi:hypothetical protein